MEEVEFWMMYGVDRADVQIKFVSNEKGVFHKHEVF